MNDPTAVMPASDEEIVYLRAMPDWRHPSWHEQQRVWARIDALKLENEINAANVEVCKKNVANILQERDALKAEVASLRGEHEPAECDEAIPGCTTRHHPPESDEARALIAEAREWLKLPWMINDDDEATMNRDTRSGIDSLVKRLADALEASAPSPPPLADQIVSAVSRWCEIVIYGKPAPNDLEALGVQNAARAVRAMICEFEPIPQPRVLTKEQLEKAALAEAIAMWGDRGEEFAAADYTTHTDGRNSVREQCLRNARAVLEAVGYRLPD